MKELTKDELKKVQYDILKDVARFCENNNIRYSLCGGTLLGAIRHGGFIPWDDDIDIFMPRPDFEIFMDKYNKSNSRYKATSPYDDYCWNKIGNVFDMETTLDYPSYRTYSDNFHVFIDIFPLDGVPDNYIARKLLFGINSILHFVYGGSAYAYVKSMRYTDKDGMCTRLQGLLRTIVKYLAITLFRPLSTSWICKLATKNVLRYKYDDSKYVAAHIGGAHTGEMEMIPRDKFEPLKKIKFESDEFYITSAAEIYLKKMYGDYMKLPPEDKRVSHHLFSAYWKK